MSVYNIKCYMSYLGLMAVDDTRWGQWQSALEFCACAETTTDSWKIQDQVPKNLYFCIAVESLTWPPLWWPAQCKEIPGCLGISKKRGHEK